MHRNQYPQFQEIISKVTSHSLSRHLVWLTLLLVLNGCGFHLKGYQQAASPVLDGGYVERGGERDTLAGVLQRNLQISGVKLATDADSGKYRVRIERDEIRSRVLAVDGSGKALDSEYRLIASFRLIVKDEEAAEAQSLELVRQLSYSGDDELGRRSEAALLIGDMRNDMANQIIRRLEAQLD
jgi:LPS-assembly lipoprotein